MRCLSKKFAFWFAKYRSSMSCWPAFKRLRRDRAPSQLASGETEERIKSSRRGSEQRTRYRSSIESHPALRLARFREAPVGWQEAYHRRSQSLAISHLAPISNSQSQPPTERKTARTKMIWKMTRGMPGAPVVSRCFLIDRDECALNRKWSLRRIQLAPVVAF
jgi:hypothetical protein